MNDWHRLTVISALAILLLAQSAAISRRSFWEDETLTARLAVMDFKSIVEERAGNNHPPLYWLSVAAWGRVFGYDEWGLKSFSLVWLSLAFYLLYRLTVEVLNKRAARMAAVLFSLSPFVLTYGHNARYYAMSAALSLLIALSAYLYRATGRAPYLGVYIAVAIALSYTMYMSVAILLAVNLWWLIVWQRSPRAGHGVLGWAMGQALVGLVFLPWLSTLIAAAGRNFSPGPVQSGVLIEILQRLAYLGFAFGVGEFYSPLNPLAWIGLVAVLLAMLMALFRRDHAIRLPGLVLLIVIGFSLIISMVAAYPQSAWQSLPNRAFFAYPFFLLVIVGGLDHLKSRQAWLAMGVFSVVYGVGMFNYFADREVVKPILTVPWKAIMEQIKAESASSALIFCSQADTACDYYARRYGWDGHHASEWAALEVENPSQIWWIHTNLGTVIPGMDNEQQVLEVMRSSYPGSHTTYYAPQNAGIRKFKSVLGQVDYAFRVELYRFDVQFPSE